MELTVTLETLSEEPTQEVEAAVRAANRPQEMASFEERGV